MKYYLAIDRGRTKFIDIVDDNGDMVKMYQYESLVKNAKWIELPGRVGPHSQYISPNNMLEQMREITKVEAMAMLIL